jgi:hypothetical protein
MAAQQEHNIAGYGVSVVTFPSLSILMQQPAPYRALKNDETSEDAVTFACTLK